MHVHISDISPELQIPLIALVVIQLGLMILSLILLWRHRDDHILGLQPGVWFIIILCGQIPGPIIFLVCLKRHRHNESANQVFEQHAGQYQHSRSTHTTISSLYPQD
ncbi:hypothetical protein GP475_04100 [Corynebacterium poyangense]|uniref:Uncharacterized protein n=1 Tax=Corynebacterium poyangense TaxID=2684405 RepID=A0A7H0SMZ3_9CORY|nr:hypothetical protein [Corynebacterium poyangense]MBZ8176246.1 hypothetical protein [Corynebacterium poyangense]QNQ89918.1 hypothetical protein GP475_04100 [Corynebacterium poyangense]